MQGYSEIMWAAGFWDGEGCCTVQHTTGYALLAITQVNRANVERFHRAVGCGNVTGPIRRDRKPQHRWNAASRSDLLRVWSLLSPHISTEKREQMTRRFSLDRRLSIAVSRYERTLLKAVA